MADSGMVGYGISKVSSVGPKQGILGPFRGDSTDPLRVHIGYLVVGI